MKSLINKEEFIGLKDVTWLYSGAEAPPHQGVLEALNDYIRSRSLGPLGRDRNTLIEASCKSNIAKLLHGNEEDIALLSNSSEIISMIAQGLNLVEGDNVVINKLEYPSGVLPWLALKKKGVEVRVIEHNNWEVTVEDILSSVDEKTKLVMTSHVSYLSGARIDYKKLYNELKKTQALLLLDATQSLGVIPVEMYHADFVVSSSYKWLLSVHGLGILAVNPNRVLNFSSQSVGWRSVPDMFDTNRFESFTNWDDARRFELGFPSYPSIYALNFTTQKIFDIGIENIEEYVLSLGAYAIKKLKDLNYEIMTPLEPEGRAGNISIVCEQAEELSEMFKRNNIFLWGGDGRLRISIHLFNDRTDIDNFINLLPLNSEVELKNIKIPT